MADTQKDEYLLNYSDKIDLSLNEEVVTNIELEEASEVNQAGVEGRVVDSSGTPIEGATVKLFDLDFNPIIHTTTDVYGLYLFSDLEAGEYLIYATKDKYGISTKATVTVETEMVSQPNIVLTKVLNDEDAILYGVIKDTEGNVVDSLIINLYLDGELKYTTTSADDGEYIIYGIEAGEYTVEAFNDLYKYSGTYKITFAAGVIVDANITVTAYGTDLNGTINGVITQKETNTPISGAFVAVYKIVNDVETLVTGTLTDEDGRYFFGDLKEGQYIVKAKSVKTI